MATVTDTDIANTVAHFHSPHYLRHNARRLEHLASMRIPVAGMTVLEVGAGIGDHSHYYIDRGCRITITEARPENLYCLRNRYPGHDVQFLDMEHPAPVNNSKFDVIHCYGLLYHLSSPEEALEFLGECCNKILFLETCVSFGDEKQLNPVSEPQTRPSQSITGMGCRPTRALVFEKLMELFDYVYIPKTQPNHEEFPLDWTALDKHHNNISRAVFIASRETINNEVLSTSFIHQQIRHD